jgi:hypothetical protein
LWFDIEAVPTPRDHHRSIEDHRHHRVSQPNERSSWAATCGRRTAERRAFPAIDVLQSGTRREEAMIAADELAAMARLRRVLTGTDPQNALDLLIEQLKENRIER